MTIPTNTGTQKRPNNHFITQNDLVSVEGANALLELYRDDKVTELSNKGLKASLKVLKGMLLLIVQAYYRRLQDTFLI